MRASYLSGFVILTLVEAASAQSIGDTVIAVMDKVKVESSLGGGGFSFSIARTVPKGSKLTIQEIEGDKYRVTTEAGRTGWVKSWDVLPSEDAEGFFTLEIERAPKAADHSARGQLRFDRGDLLAALADFDEAVRLEPQEAWHHHRRGCALQRLRRADDAAAAFDEAIRIKPDFAEAYVNRGNMWRSKRDYDRAVADFDAAIEIAPEHGEIYLLRGVTRSAKGDTLLAIFDLEDAVRLAPKDAAAHGNLAWVLATCPNDRLRNSESAVLHAEAALGLAGAKDARALDVLAAAHAEAGDFKLAVKRQTEAIEAAQEWDKDEYRARLALYERHEPFRAPESESGI